MVRIAFRVKLRMSWEEGRNEEEGRFSSSSGPMRFKRLADSGGGGEADRVVMGDEEVGDDRREGTGEGRGAGTENERSQPLRIAESGGGGRCCLIHSRASVIGRVRSSSASSAVTRTGQSIAFAEKSDGKTNRPPFRQFPSSSRSEPLRRPLFSSHIR